MTNFKKNTFFSNIGGQYIREPDKKLTLNDMLNEIRHADLYKFEAWNMNQIYAKLKVGYLRIHVCDLDYTELIGFGEGLGWFNPFTSRKIREIRDNRDIYYESGEQSASSYMLPLYYNKNTLEYEVIFRSELPQVDPASGYDLQYLFDIWIQGMHLLETKSWSGYEFDYEQIEPVIEMEGEFKYPVLITSLVQTDRDEYEEILRYQLSESSAKVEYLDTMTYKSIIYYDDTGRLLTEDQYDFHRNEILVSGANIHEYEPISSWSSESKFQPTADYYMQYFGNLGYHIPERFVIDKPKTLTLWKKDPYLAGRYVLIKVVDLPGEISSLEDLPMIGAWINAGINLFSKRWFYAMKPSVGFDGEEVIKPRDDAHIYKTLGRKQGDWIYWMGYSPPIYNTYFIAGAFYDVWEDYDIATVWVQEEQE